MTLTGVVEIAGRILHEHATILVLALLPELLPDAPCEDSAPLLGYATVPDAAPLREPDFAASSHRITQGSASHFCGVNPANRHDSPAHNVAGSARPSQVQV